MRTTSLSFMSILLSAILTSSMFLVGTAIGELPSEPPRIRAVNTGAMLYRVEMEPTFQDLLVQYAREAWIWILRMALQLLRFPYRTIGGGSGSHWN